MVGGGGGGGGGGKCRRRRRKRDQFPHKALPRVHPMAHRHTRAYVRCALAPLSSTLPPPLPLFLRYCFACWLVYCLGSILPGLSRCGAVRCGAVRSGAERGGAGTRRNGDEEQGEGRSSAPSFIIHLETSHVGFVVQSCAGGQREGEDGGRVFGTLRAAACGDWSDQHTLRM